jgi:hypothetical protein
VLGSLMDEMVLEIVRLASGEFVIRRSGEEEALMTLNLSQVVQDNLLENTEELARRMLVAGAHMMSDLVNDEELGIDTDDVSPDDMIRPSTIH